MSQYKFSIHALILCGSILLSASNAAARGPQSLRLVGVHVAHHGDPLAIIEDSNSKQQDVFPLNAEVFNNGKLRQITKTYVVLNYQGKEIAIGFKKGVRIRAEALGNKNTSALNAIANLGSSPSQATVQSQNQITSPVSTIEIKAEELKSIWKELPQTVRDAKPRLVSEQGQVIGLGLFTISDQSILAKIGFKNGDVLKSINGQRITSPRQALQLLKYSTSPDSAGTHIVITRNGNEQLIVVGSI